jgi:DNA-directed RNA polymerase subunit RPC12/RpoP
MNDNNLKASDEAIKDSVLSSFKPTKMSSPESENSLIKMLDAIVNALGKHTYLCGAFIIYHNNESRPQVCIRCGSKIDWEGEYITRIKACPKCNREYDSSANYLHFTFLQLH